MSSDRSPGDEIRDVFDALAEKAPKVISGLVQSVFSEDTGRQLGKATGAFYQELIDAGIPKEDALQMAKDYVNSLRDAVSKSHTAGGPHGGHGHAAVTHLVHGKAAGQARVVCCDVEEGEEESD